MRGMMEECVGRLRGRRSKVVSMAAVLVASLATLGAASPALGSSFQKEFIPFAQCPVNTPGVSECAVSTVSSGEFHLGNNTVPINKTITLQGGINLKTHELVPAIDGNTLSKTPLVLPGGLLGIELLGNLTEVTVTAEIAGPVHLNLANLGGLGPLVNLPVKVKLDNLLLGPSCYIGSNSEPVLLNLTTGTTNPPPPNQPISGKFGTALLAAEGRILGATNNTVVDNAFAAPGANGCAGILSLVVDPSVDLKAGLPAAAGHNTAIMNGMLEQADARIVKTEQEIPLFGRCTKVEGVKVGKTTVFSGKYSSSQCVTEAVESLKPGKYEWAAGPGPNKKFTGTTEITKLETVGKAKITCSAGSSQGEYTGLKTIQTSYAFTGCENVGPKEACQSSGASPGEIRTTSLVGELGFIKDNLPLTPIVGLDLKPASAGPLATFKCGAMEATVEGSVIGAVAAIDHMGATSTLKFKESVGKQGPEQFEELAKDTLSTTFGSGAGKNVEQTGLVSKTAINSEELIEIKARAF
jgi:hypothetical protein